MLSKKTEVIVWTSFFLYYYFFYYLFIIIIELEWICGHVCGVNMDVCVYDAVEVTGDVNCVCMQIWM